MPALEWREYLMFVRLRRWETVEVLGRRGLFFLVVNDFGNKMSTFSSNLGTFPRDSICWGSFSLAYSFHPFHTLFSPCSACHTLSLCVGVPIADFGQSCPFTLPLLFYVSCCTFTCQPPLSFSFMFLFLPERSKECARVRLPISSEMFSEMPCSAMTKVLICSSASQSQFQQLRIKVLKQVVD